MAKTEKQKTKLELLIAISAKELAEKMSLSPRTIWRLLYSGKLPKPVSLGGSKRWILSDIELFLSCNCDMAEFETRKDAK